MKKSHLARGAGGGACSEWNVEKITFKY